jgi:hypothetical protein
MTSMQLSAGDRQFLNNCSTLLLHRLKQQCPWPFDIDQTESLYIPRPLLKLKHEFKSRSADGLLFSGRQQRVVIHPGIVLPASSVTLVLISKHNFWVANSSRSKLSILKTSPHFPEFIHWLRGTVKVSRAMHIAYNLSCAVTQYSTTYPQVLKAMPEFLYAVESATPELPRWGYRNQINKYNEVMKILKHNPPTRARKLKPELVAELEQWRALSEAQFAKAVMLPAHNGLCKDSVFDDTWVYGDGLL